MTRYLPIILILVAPLALFIIIAVSVYGLDGPPDDPRTNAMAMRLGTTYGVYAVIAFVLWRRR